MVNFMTLKVNIFVPKPLNLHAYYQQSNVEYTQLDVLASVACRGSQVCLMTHL
jgi:hypothetical protein